MPNRHTVDAPILRRVLGPDGWASLLRIGSHVGAVVMEWTLLELFREADRRGVQLLSNLTFAAVGPDRGDEVRLAAGHDKMMRAETGIASEATESELAEELERSNERRVETLAASPPRVVPVPDRPQAHFVWTAEELQRVIGAAGVEGVVSSRLWIEDDEVHLIIEVEEGTPAVEPFYLVAVGGECPVTRIRDGRPVPEMRR